MQVWCLRQVCKAVPSLTDAAPSLRHHPAVIMPYTQWLCLWPCRGVCSPAMIQLLVAVFSVQCSPVNFAHLLLDQWEDRSSLRRPIIWPTCFVIRSLWPRVRALIGASNLTEGAQREGVKGTQPTSQCLFIVRPTGQRRPPHLATPPHFKGAAATERAVTRNRQATSSLQLFYRSLSELFMNT